MDEAARGLSISLAPAFGHDRARAEALARRLTAYTHDLEASLRIGPSGVARGGRMMLERVDQACGQAIAEGLSIGWPERAEMLTEATRALGLPLIAGWDVGGAGPLYKLYANASDASMAQRASLRARLSLPGALPDAQIIGINVGRASLSTKLYVQRPSLEALAPRADVPASLASAEGAAWVASYDVEGDALVLRAIFVASVHGREQSLEHALEALTGHSYASLAGAFPFAVGPLRQLGWAPGGDVTVYAKMSGGAAPVHALAPLAVFRRAGAEVGLYVTPSADTPRAYARTAKHALTFRTREGQPDRDALEALAAWAAARVSAAETSGPVAETDFDDPIAGWARVPAAPSS